MYETTTPNMVVFLSPKVLLHTKSEDESYRDSSLDQPTPASGYLRKGENANKRKRGIDPSFVLGGNDFVVASWCADVHVHIGHKMVFTFTSTRLGDKQGWKNWFAAT